MRYEALVGGDGAELGEPVLRRINVHLCSDSMSFRSEGRSGVSMDTLSCVSGRGAGKVVFGQPERVQEGDQALLMKCCAGNIGVEKQLARMVACGKNSHSQIWGIGVGQVFRGMV